MATAKKPVSNNSAQSNFLAIFFIITIAAGIYWYINLEFTYEEIDRGYQGEAITNPFLAADYFLRRMGQKTEKVKLFTEKRFQLEAEDTLFVPGKRIAYNQRRSDYLLDWVKQGGHLIITAKAFKEDDYQARDFILDAVGLQLAWQINEGDSLEEDDPVSLDIEDEEDFWQIDFVDYQVVTYMPEFDQEIIWSVSNGNKLHAVQIKLGDGRLTLLSDTKMFRNDYIDEYDHAAFLYALSNDQAQDSASGVFYYSLFEDQDSLLAWLWNHANPLMISILIMFVVFLWKIVPRFGPLINVHQPVSRRFLDHLEASGNYHWRQGHYSLLVREVRKQLSSQMKLKYPEWVHMSQKDQVTHLTDLSQLEPSVIEKALFEMQIERVDDFVTKIKILEKLRKSL